MNKSIKKICKPGMLFGFSLLFLSACTGREDIALELSEADTLNQYSAADLDSNLSTVKEEKIYVHICGAVVNPGVYELDGDSRVFEVIEAAGGFSEDACQDYVNQAGRLNDGERLVIPTIEEIETAKADGNTGASSSASGLVNINTASESELGSISGIGAGKAAAIVKYREENGSFASVEDIMKVSGIKEGTYEKIKDKITVN